MLDPESQSVIPDPPLYIELMHCSLASVTFLANINRSEHICNPNITAHPLSSTNTTSTPPPNYTYFSQKMNIQILYFNLFRDNLCMVKDSIDSTDNKKLSPYEPRPIAHPLLVGTTLLDMMVKPQSPMKVKSPQSVMQLCQPPLHPPYRQALPARTLVTPPTLLKQARIQDQQGRFKTFQEEKWKQRLQELRYFRQKHGHCMVPYSYQPNLQLADWVKRQRRQYKLFQDGNMSTMTEDRLEMLEDMGFVWDRHESTWNQRMEELRIYRAQYGNYLVPRGYKQNYQLSIW